PGLSGQRLQRSGDSGGPAYPPHDSVLPIESDLRADRTGPGGRDNPLEPALGSDDARSVSISTPHRFDNERNSGVDLSSGRCSLERSCRHILVRVFSDDPNRTNKEFHIVGALWFRKRYAAKMTKQQAFRPTGRD